MVFEQRLTIVTGKGGVGRSAVASAIARHRAQTGARVLALAIDDGTGLGAHLNVRLDHEPHEVAPRLSAAVIDPAAALDEYVRQRVRAAPIALATRVFRVLAHTVPGVRDIVLIGKAIHEATTGAWDAVIVDASPAGQIQSTLGAPRTIAELVPRGTVHEQATSLQTTLSDPQITQLVVVATPEELALAEAAAVQAAADASGIAPNRRLIINRMLPEPGFGQPPDRVGPMRDAAILHLDVRRAQVAAIEGLDVAIALPLLFGAHRPVDLSHALTGMFA